MLRISNTKNGCCDFYWYMVNKKIVDFSFNKYLLNLCCVSELLKVVDYSFTFICCLIICKVFFHIQYHLAFIYPSERPRVCTIISILQIVKPKLKYVKNKILDKNVGCFFLVRLTRFKSWLTTLPLGILLSLPVA